MHGTEINIWLLIWKRVSDMERSDKIITVICLLVFVAVVLMEHKHANSKKPPVVEGRLMLSLPAFQTDVGIAYLVSALPLRRPVDDMMPNVSIGRDEATATGATAS